MYIIQFFRVLVCKHMHKHKNTNVQHVQAILQPFFSLIPVRSRPYCGHARTYDVSCRVPIFEYLREKLSILS